MFFGMYAPVPHITVGSKEIARSVKGALAPLPEGAIDPAFTLAKDVLCAADKALEENRIVAERRCRFLSGFCNLGLEFAFAFDDSHAAPASAERSLYDQWETDLFRNLAGDFCVCDWLFGAWNHRHPGPLCQAPGSRLIAQ